MAIKGQLALLTLSVFLLSPGNAINKHDDDTNTQYTFDTATTEYAPLPQELHKGSTRMDVKVEASAPIAQILSEALPPIAQNPSEASAPIAQNPSEAPSSNTVMQNIFNAAAAKFTPLPQLELNRRGTTQVEMNVMVNKIEKNMKMTIRKTENILAVLHRRMAANKGSPKAAECMQTCTEVYEQAIDDMKGSMQDLSSGNYYKVNIDISAVSTDVETCEECYSDMLGDDPELKNFDKWIQGVTSECLTDLQTVSHR